MQLLTFKMFEALLTKDSQSIEFDYELRADQHFFDRTSRSDNEPDKNGKIVIEEIEVEKSVKLAMKKIAKTNLFNNGLYWTPKTDELNKEILVKAPDNLNIVLHVQKQKQQYILTVITVMRKKDFGMKANTLLIDIR